MTHDADIVVVGGGIAGLVVAAEAAEAGARVALLEAGDRTGGMLHRGRVAGVDLDLGAESFATRTDGVPRLVEDLALVGDDGEPLRLTVPAPGPARLVSPRAGGGLSRMPLPRRTVVGVPADPLASDVVAIIGDRAARRAAAEARGLAIDPSASFGALVAERLGDALVERLVDPLCRSVYSQSAWAAPLARLHPRLWAELVRTGSLLQAAAATAPAAAGGAAVGGVSGGMWRLAEATRRAATARGARVRTGAAVRSLRPAGASGRAPVVAELSDGSQVRAGSVVIATGPRAAASLLGLDALAPASASEVRLVTLAVSSPELADAPVGSGVIVAPGVDTAAKALTHIDAKWQWAREALPAGTHLVRLSARDADGAGLDDAADLARELRSLTGVSVHPSQISEIVTTRWRDAVVPAATPEWTDAVERARERGIRVAGAVSAGTGLASVIPHARGLARALVLGHDPDNLSATPARKESP